MTGDITPGEYHPRTNYRGLVSTGSRRTGSVSGVEVELGDRCDLNFRSEKDCNILEEDRA